MQISRAALDLTLDTKSEFQQGTLCSCGTPCQSTLCSVYPAPSIQKDSQLTKPCNLWSKQHTARYLELKDGLPSAMRAKLKCGALFISRDANNSQEITGYWQTFFCN